MQTSVATKPIALTTPVRFALVTILGAIVTALAAQVNIPLLWTPVPITLQSLSVLVIGVYGSRFASPAAAVSSQLVYLGLGVAGLPVFAIAMGATLGYVLAFPAAVGIASLAGIKGISLAARALALCAASSLILGAGAAWLGWVTQASLTEAMAYGVTPFVAIEAAKVAVVALSLIKTQRR